MAEQDNSIFKLFGFELKRAEDKQKEEKTDRWDSMRLKEAEMRFAKVRPGAKTCSEENKLRLLRLD